MPDKPSSSIKLPQGGLPPRPPRVDKLLGTLLDRKYRILEKIGEGGMGSVYSANQESIDRNVAIKVLLSKLAEDDVALRRFELEAKAISKMQHPNTVTIYDYGRIVEENESERLFIVMELLKGSTLTKVFRENKTLPGPRASRILRQVCASLAEAHAVGIIHRDLKPDNIFLTEVGGDKDWVKVLDFGVAKLADSEGIGTLTQTGMIFGTPKYMSPEQAEGKPIDHRTDIYALGVVLYELLSGRPPFTSDTPIGLLLKHISEPPKSLHTVAANLNIDPRLDQIVMRALEKNPDARQQQVMELAAELEAYEHASAGIQSIPTDGGIRASGAYQSGMPTELVPKTLAGPLSSEEILAPDRPLSDLSVDIPREILRASPLRGALSTGQVTAKTELPPTAPGITTPVENSDPGFLGSGWFRAFRFRYVVGCFALALVFGSGLFVWSYRYPQTVVSKTVPVTELESESEPVRFVAPNLAPEGLTPGPEVIMTESERAQTKGANTIRRTVVVELESTPSTAVVRLAGAQVGVTPVTIDVPKDKASLTFTFLKRGYRPTRRVVVSDRDRSIKVSLKKRRSRGPKKSLCPDGHPPPCKASDKDSVDLKVDDLK